MPTYHHDGRTYVLGELGSRYRIHVVNPTARRVEAVSRSTGSTRSTAPPPTSRTSRATSSRRTAISSSTGSAPSMQEVATFRFSSVRDSYAGRKGEARNVGVIGVAFFAEREPPPPPPRVYYYPPASPSYDRAPAPEKQASAGGAGRGASSAPATAAPQPSDSSAMDRGDRVPAGSVRGRRLHLAGARAAPAPRSRHRVRRAARLGRRVHVVRATRPDAPHGRRRDRYDDRAGLLAMGVLFYPRRPTEAELRETASPFPANGFASPPPPRY